MLFSSLRYFPPRWLWCSFPFFRKYRLLEFLFFSVFFRKLFKSDTINSEAVFSSEAWIFFVWCLLWPRSTVSQLGITFFPSKCAKICVSLVDSLWEVYHKNVLIFPRRYYAYSLFSFLLVFIILPHNIHIHIIFCSRLFPIYWNMFQ